MITLYERTDCPFCWKVRLAMAELDIDYKSIACELGNAHPEVSRLSPVGTVPVLVDGDLAIWDSAVIIDYLDAVYGPGQLLPVEPAAQARQRLLQAYSDKCVGPALRELVFEKRAKPRKDWDWPLIEASEQRWRDCQQWLEQHATRQLSKGPKVLNAAACAIAARAGVAAAYGSPIGREFPALYQWFTAICERPSWASAYPTSFIAKEENLITI